MSAQELADILGVKQPTISSYETENREPPLKTLLLICDIFNVTAHQLLTVDLSKRTSNHVNLVEEESPSYGSEKPNLWDYRKLVKEVEDLRNIVETLKIESS